MSNEMFEMVIRRAAELQAKEADAASGGDSMSGAEVLRIGRELGLSTRHLHQAMAEIDEPRAGADGFIGKIFGPDEVRASRTVAGSAESIAKLLEHYLIEKEYLCVLRRFPDRVLFTRAPGAGAAVGRAMSKAFSRSALLDVSNLEMSVRPLEEGYSYVTLSTSMHTSRTTAAATSLVGGGFSAAAAGAFLSIAIAPPVAVLALPVLGGAVFGARAIHHSVLRNVHIRIESLLDRLEHGELTVAGAARARSRINRKFGFPEEGL